MQLANSLFPKLLAPALFVLTLTIAGSVQGAYFLKLGDIKGESRTADGQHDGWIVLSSASWSDGSAPTAGSLARVGPGRGELTVVRSVDTSSPALQQACTGGSHYPEATLHVTREGGNPDRPIIVGYKLFDVTLSCARSAASSDGSRSTEQFSLNYTRIEIVPTVSSGQAEPATIRPQRVTPRPTVRGVQ